MRLLIAGDALKKQDQSSYMTGVKSVQSVEYNMYVVGDAIYVISPIALWLDYVKLKHKAIVQNEQRKQDKHSEHNDLRQALLSESEDDTSKRNNYGSNSDVLHGDP